MDLELMHEIAALRARLAEIRRSGLVIGFVPTMGALHAGHGRLIEVARRESGCVVVSIFVNPIQFDRPDDYDRYPRTLESDLEFCRDRGVNIVFAPSAQQIYSGAQRSFVEVTRISDHLCGKFRPGHFRGVATVVAKLFNIVQPDRAYFGEKDAQQLAVIRRMVGDLNIPVTIVEVPTVREPDGLAVSSRNRHLSPEERRLAPLLSRALQAAQQSIAGAGRDAAQVREAALEVLRQQPQLRVEYLEIVDPVEMQPVEQITGPVRVAGAVWIGSTRLIDNVLCEPAGHAAAAPGSHR